MVLLPMVIRHPFQSIASTSTILINRSYNSVLLSRHRYFFYRPSLSLRRSSFQPHVDRKYQQLDHPLPPPMPITAQYISRSIDFTDMCLHVFPSYSHTIGRESAIASMVTTDTNGDLNQTYIVMFGYGSVVFINVPDDTRTVLFRKMLSFCHSPSHPPRTEEYGLIIDKSMDISGYAQNDHVVVKNLDINSVKVIAGVLGLSVALDYYSAEVNSMVSDFIKFNTEIKKNGKFTHLHPKPLFKWIAKGNLIRTDVISKLKLLERSETAWNYEDHALIWNALRSEFEIESRFESMQYKLDLIHENTKFFLEILQARHSSRLEWIIIILISGEILIALYPSML